MKRQSGADEAFDEKAADAQAQEIRERIKAMGTVNVGAIEEYAALNERVTEQTVQQNDILKAKQDLEALIVSLEKEMRKVFTEQFTLLQELFVVSFKRLFGGGHAELKLTNPEDPLHCDVEVIVQPPGQETPAFKPVFQRRTRADRDRAAVCDAKAPALPVLHSGRGRGGAGRDERRQLRRLSARNGRRHAVCGDHPPQGHHGAVRFACSAWRWRNAA